MRERGVQAAAPQGKRSAAHADRLRTLIGRGVVPGYFLGIPERLRRLPGPEREPSRREHQFLVAGGTDLFVQRPGQMLEGQLSFVSDSPQLRTLRVEEDRLLLGAGLSMEQVKEIPEVKDQLPQLSDALSSIASAPIRRRATLGGNIINASPIGDFTVMLLALAAVLGLSNGRAVRQLPLEKEGTSCPG